MTKPPERLKPREEWTVAEVLHHDRTGEAPTSAAYRAYVAEVHIDAGLEPPGEAKTLDEMTPGDHFAAIKIRRNPR